MSDRVSVEEALEAVREWADDLAENELADAYAKIVSGVKYEYDEETECLVEIDESEETVRAIVEDVKHWTDEETTPDQALEYVVRQRRADLERTIKEARDRLAAVPQLAEVARQRITVTE